MHLVIEHRDRAFEVVVEVDDPSAVVGDVVAQIAGPGAAAVSVEGRALALDLPLAEAGLVDGMVVVVHPLALDHAGTAVHSVPRAQRWWC